MKKEKTVSKTKKELDTIFSVWIRLRDKKCITCLATKNLQAGHFVSRKYNSTRYDEVNVNAQCVRCNMFDQGRQYDYGIKLNEMYGPDTADNLKGKSHETKKYTVPELEELKKHYLELIRELGEG